MEYSTSAGDHGDNPVPKPVITSAPTRRDRRQVSVLAAASSLILACIGYLHFFVPPSLAPRVNVRWADDISDTSRTTMERQLKLVAGERVEGTTWAYDLVDPSPQGIDAIVSHPSVADTHYIDRARRTLSEEMRLGTTPIRGGLSRWRDGAVVPWLGRLAASLLIVSTIWLTTTGRLRRRAHKPTES